jgi:hypothetical protein
MSRRGPIDSSAPQKPNHPHSIEFTRGYAPRRHGGTEKKEENEPQITQMHTDKTNNQFFVLNHLRLSAFICG